MRFFPVALALVAAPAAAGPVPADPVERCRGLAAIDAAAPYAAAQFGRVEAVGEDGCRFTDVSFEAAPDATVRIGEVEISNFDFAGAYAEGPPDAMTMRVDDLVFTGPDGAALLGPGADPIDLVLDFAVEAGTFRLGEFSIVSASTGDLWLAAAVTGVDFAQPNPEIALRTARIASAELRLDAKILVSLIEPVLFGTSMTAMTETIRDPTAALQAAKPRLAMGIVMLSSLGLPEPTMTALSAFVEDLPTPRGPLTITLSPANPVPLLFLVAPPDDATLRTSIERLNLEVAY